MGFTRLLGGSKSADRDAKARSMKKQSDSSLSTTSMEASISSEFVADETHLKPFEPEAPDLRELNACLEALAVVFPDIQVHVFREMLCNFDGESRLAVVADALLKNRVTWVKGRWKIPNQEKAQQKRRTNIHGEGGVVPRNEVFRDAGYKKAAEALAWQEFRGLQRSVINAVLAEFNYSYLDARETLVKLSSESWRYAISQLFFRRKAVAATEAATHPLVIWKSSGRGSIVPCIKSTGNAELDRELYDELIVPLKERARLEQEEKDRALAADLNTKEAEDLDSTVECACCYGDCTFEELTACNTEGHMICFRCVRHSIQEAVFGQGWQKTINKQTGTLKCPAVESAECTGHIPQDHMYRAMLDEKKGHEILHKLEQRLADHSLLSSGLPLVRCPFCSYAEIDDIYVPVSEAQLRVRADNIYTLIFLVLLIGTIPFVLPLLLCSFVLAILLHSKRTLGDQLITQFREAMARHRRRTRGLKFTCQNKDCHRSSCLSCQKEWVDIHICHESSLVTLRTQVEQAMSMAIKRVCPKCNTSFVKTAGCNKLTCPCGYKMCYVCRKDIGGTGDGPDVGYRHFCEHFRPEGDPRACKECNKCNLWESENTDAVLKQAKEEAERKWRETEKRDLSRAERQFLETGLLGAPGAGGAGQTREAMVIREKLRRGRLPSVAEICDFVVEIVFV
ncbi:putative E3 ubiquitin-protein ligase ARI4 [Naviculisporaceae sp. PSN 640]